MESKRCGYTLFVAIVAFCSIATVRGDDWSDDELDFTVDKSEARFLNFNNTGLPDAYVSHFWFTQCIWFWKRIFCSYPFCFCPHNLLIMSPLYINLITIVVHMFSDFVRSNIVLHQYTLHNNGPYFAMYIQLQIY